MDRDWFGRNRYLCDVLEDMRKCEQTRNYSSLAGLIEEAQVMGNRMESALSDQKDLVELTKKYSDKKSDYKKLKQELDEIKSKLEPLKKEYHKLKSKVGQLKSKS